MKKLMVVVLAAFSIFAVANTASAFESESLVAVLYDVDTNTEIGLNLGDLTSMDLTAQNVVLKEAGTFTLDYDKVGVFASYGALTSSQNFFALTQDIEATVNTSQFIGFTSAATTYNAGYTTEGSDLATTAPASYMTLMNSSGTANGAYNAFNSHNFDLGEGAISEDGVRMYLYQFDVVTAVYNDNDLTDFAVATIDFLADGSVVMNANAVPVPGAILLLGSGLVGLVGLRRKMN